jgi:serine/threonine protein kinase
VALLDHSSATKYYDQRSLKRTLGDSTNLPSLVETQESKDTWARGDLVMKPKGFCSLHHPTLPFDSDTNGQLYEQCMIKWLMQIQAQLLVMHDNGLCHGDVKPSNMVCYSNAKECAVINLDATLIDFEHVSFLATPPNSCTLSGSHRYASRHILAAVQGLDRRRREYLYSRADDMESLFYSAFEILHQHKKLPWHQVVNLVEATSLRSELLMHWDNSKHRSHFSSDAWTFLTQAMLVVSRFNDGRALWPYVKYLCECSRRERERERERESVCVCE